MVRNLSVCESVCWHRDYIQVLYCFSHLGHLRLSKSDLQWCWICHYLGILGYIVVSCSRRPTGRRQRTSGSRTQNLLAGGPDTLSHYTILPHLLLPNALQWIFVCNFPFLVCTCKTWKWGWPGESAGLKVMHTRISMGSIKHMHFKFPF